MFNQLADQFKFIFKNIRGLGKISESNIRDTVRLIRRTLIDADVNFKVVKVLISRLENKVIGTKVLNSIKPGEQFIKIMRDEIVEILGTEKSKLKLDKNPSVILLAGLQGAGKTTTAAKLANLLHESGKNTMLIAADIYRPAAVEQLITMGNKVNSEVYHDKIDNPLQICIDGINKACKMSKDVVIIDTAGRLHVDEIMMKEIESIANEVKPSEILLVADSMMGQDAVKSAKLFQEYLSISGIVLTKLDGDSRGGAALSIKEVTGVDIKYISTSEDIRGFKLFNSKSMADRILGLGDIVTLVEKAQIAYDKENVKELGKKISNYTFDLDDFKLQLEQLKKMGPMNQVLKLIPGIDKKMTINDDRQFDWTVAIINSMTSSERKKPENINGSRKLRISKGSGRSVQEVNSLLKQFGNMKKMMKKMKKNKHIKMPGLADFGSLN